MNFFEWLLEVFKVIFCCKCDSNNGNNSNGGNYDETGGNLGFEEDDEEENEVEDEELEDEEEQEVPEDVDDDLEFKDDSEIIEPEEDQVIATPAPIKQYPKLCVCLDNGHGENTGGKCSPWVAYKVPPELFFREYLFNREVVDLIVKGLAVYGIEVYLTCPELTDASLTTRYKRANAHATQHPNKKHIFISVHANAAGNGKSWLNARGWSAWTTKGQNNSDKLAECLYDAAEEILPKLGQVVRYDKSDGDRDYEENFTVIYGANMPAVLTENLFYDNVNDVKFLLSDEGKRAIANIHIKGIIKFAETFYKM